MDFRTRQSALRLRIEREGLDAVLVSHLPNIRYLTGFSGSNGLLLVLPESATLFTDGRYRHQAAAEVHAARLVIPPKGDLWKAAAGRAAKLRRLGFEAERVSVAQRARLLRHWPQPAHRLRPIAGWVEAQRALKQPEEVAAIRRAVELASSVFPAALQRIRPGTPETEAAGWLEYQLRRAGGEGLAFETILAAGPRGANVHGHATAAPLPRRGFVVMDYGVMLAGYASDMTRTVHLGRAGRKQRAVYASVLAAQEEAIAAVRAGAPAAAIDRAARQRLRREGWGRYFPHSTGHGVGLEIHEAPRLAATSIEVLAAGQVITVEPGVYIPGWGGVRIEDVVLVTAHGAEVLTPTPKVLLEL
ncbi:MAG: M24 family metallopeptidase [Terriglobales bacterium]